MRLDAFCERRWSSLALMCAPGILPSRCTLFGREATAALSPQAHVLKACIWLQVSPELVTVDGEPLDHHAGILVLVNKPCGLVCSHDEQEGPNVYSLLPLQWASRRPQVTSVGRCDFAAHPHITHQLRYWDSRKCCQFCQCHGAPEWRSLVFQLFWDVRRLDKDTSGLILITDQSHLVHQLTSPHHKVTKGYEAVLENAVPESQQADMVRDP